MSELYWGYLTLGPRRAKHGDMCKHGRGRCLNQPGRLRVAIQPLPVFLTSDRDEARIPPARSASAPARRCWIMSPWVGCGNTGGRTDAERHESGGAVKHPDMPKKARKAAVRAVSLVRLGLRCLPLFRWSIGG